MNNALYRYCLFIGYTSADAKNGTINKKKMAMYFCITNIV